MQYEAVIGLEVHAQLLTKSKIFCGCRAAFGAPPNANTCPVCLGLPGALPVLNRAAVSNAIKAALALNCQIRSECLFARKNYFYPDLPKGYQISMYELPLGYRGRVEVLTGERSEVGHVVNRRNKTFRIHRVHMEEDAGKLIHEAGSNGKSLVDFNRSGVPLIEIVSEPDFRSSQEAYDYLAHLRRTLMYIDVCDGNMEEGSLRCDANVSVRPRGARELGTKVEIKNLNSLRFLQKALDYEIQRQVQVLSQGGMLTQETRLWDEENDRTITMRTKEEAHDYRYFPEPDLLPLSVSQAWLEDIRSTLVELPEAKRARFVAEYRLSEDDSLLLSSTRALADYYEACTRLSGNPRASANWILVDLAYELKTAGKEITESPVTAENLAELIRLVDDGTISGKMAKTIFSQMCASGDSPQAVLSRSGLKQISDEGQIASVVQGVLNENPQQVEQYRAGREKLFGFFVGEVMKKTKGQANPQKVSDLLRKNLQPNS